MTDPRDPDSSSGVPRATPALTADEWTEEIMHISEGLSDADSASAALCYLVGEPSRRRHAAAALCLYGQPFGFTEADVNELRDLVKSWEEEASISENAMNGAAARADDRGIWGKNAAACRSRAEKARSIANRIAALLPPVPYGARVAPGESP